MNERNATGERIIEFRDALCEAMSKKCERSNEYFLLGEEVAQYNGAYKVSKGMLDEFGPRTSHRYANQRKWFFRYGYWRCNARSSDQLLNL